MKTRAEKVLPTAKLSLRDRLSRLSFLEACKLLGPEGRQLIQQNANRWEFQLPGDVYLHGDLFCLRFPCEGSGGGPLTVSITLMAEARQRLHFVCNRCRRACEHVGATFSLILEDKMSLGLAAQPREPRTPVESLNETELVERALAERAERRAVKK